MTAGFMACCEEKTGGHRPPLQGKASVHGIECFLKRWRDGDIMRNGHADEDGSTPEQRKCVKGAASATGLRAKATTRRDGGITAEPSALAWEPIRTAAASVRPTSIHTAGSRSRRQRTMRSTPHRHPDRPGVCGGAQVAQPHYRLAGGAP